MELRSFTKGDWDAYAGAEGDDPKIGFTADGTAVIVDETGVQVLKANQEYRNGLCVFQMRCPQPTGEMLVSAMKDKDFSPERLATLGWERIL